MTYSTLFELVLGFSRECFELLVKICMEMLGTNIVDPDQTPHSVVSDLGLHCLCMSLKWVSNSKRAKLVA